MKKLYLILIIICSIQLSYPQQFHSLDGIESPDGQTLLIYRLGTEQYTYNPVYKFNVQTGYEQQIMDAHSIIYPVGADIKSVTDFEFFPGDTSNFINVGDLIYMDYGSYIARIDSVVFGFYSPFYRIDISKQNPQKVFVFGNGGPVRSWDGGYTFPEDSVTLVTNFIPIALADFDDEVMFGFDEDNKFAKNTIVVDTSLVLVDQHFRILYDVNQFHIYRVNNGYGGYSLNVSNNKGNAFTWTKTYQSENPIFVSIDSTQSGLVYLADGRKIYKSINNGYTFSEFKSLPSKLIGIYKKPNSEILNAASSRMIYKITPDSTIIFKSLPTSEEEFGWFPLAIGNRWAYDSYTIDGIHYEFAGTKYMEVVKDTVINNKSYFVVENDLISAVVFPQKMYLRVDSETGLIYRYWEELNGEYIFHNLNAEVGDIVFYPLDPYEPFYILEYEQPFYFLGTDTYQRMYLEAALCTCSHSLIKGFGLANTFFNEVFGSENTLKGCVIDGILYGDTTNVVDVDPDPNPIPTEYILEQNYPNPFNPNTRIDFSIPNNAYVSLKVYDILGTEVAKLIFNEQKAAGRYEVKFDASRLASGTYIYKLQAGDFIQTKKMMLLK